MKISTKLRYASRLLSALAETGSIINTSDLGNRLNVSPLYLRPIALELEKRGIIKSHRGARGGYQLLKPPSEITLYELAKIFGDFTLADCLDDPDICANSSVCRARNLWLNLRNCIESFLKGVTIEDLMTDKEKTLKEQI